MNSATFAATLGVCLLALSPLQAQNDGRRALNVTPGNPITISEPGHYYLTRGFNSNSPGVAIQINASGVTLDLNGQEVSGPGGKQGTGVRVDNAAGVTLMNGSISNFAFGVVVNGSANVVVKGLRVRGQGLQVTAPPPETGIMIAQSRNVTVEGNSFYNTGLGIFVRGGMSWGNRIVHNNITAGMNGILGICYNPTPDDPMSPRGDLIYANHIAGYGIGIQMAATSTANVISENTLAVFDKGLELLSATNTVMDNVEVKLP